MESSLLIIFAKNPLLGRVKTRLARDIGSENALKIYLHLLKYTHKITKTLDVTKALYYSDFIPDDDRWFDETYDRYLQVGDHLGTRMSNAVGQGFESNSDKVVIIGSDCYELKQAIIEDAFHQLNYDDFVIGPAVDGGYYLLGMKRLEMSIFENKHWSTPSVLRDTIKSIQRLGMNYHLLPELRDVDTVDDLGELRDLIHDKSERDEHIHYHSHTQ